MGPKAKKPHVVLREGLRSRQSTTEPKLEEDLLEEDISHEEETLEELEASRAVKRTPTPSKPTPKRTPARSTPRGKKVADNFKRTMRVVTTVKPTTKPPVQDNPVFKWTEELFILDQDGNEHTADVFQKVTYKLHETFENPHQTFTKPPFTCTNEGWGAFFHDIDLYTTEKTKVTISQHDLNFMEDRYVLDYQVTFKNPSQALQEKLRATGPLPSDGDKKKKLGAGAKKSGSQKHDYEKIAQAVEKLDEEDLLKVIQLMNENKGPDTYIKADVETNNLLEAGEFSIDLYTMPDALTAKIWDYLSTKGFVP